MEMFNKYKSPLGYQVGENQIDTYGVDHSGFSVRDELAYQRARQQRENQIIQNFHNQGITQDYPQQGTNFWGNSPDDNFGFGSSQISSNIENIQNTPVPNFQNQTYSTSAIAKPCSSSSFSNSINPYARIKQLLEQNDYTQNQAQSFEQKVNDTNQLAQNSLPNSGSEVDILSAQNSTDKIFDRVFNKTLGEEGGYEDRPNKIDTATKNGIQQATLIRFKNKHPELAQGFPEHVKNLTQEQARLIARKDYYEAYRIGEITSPALQETMFDSFFNHSPNAPSLWAQRAINQNTNMKVQEDGVFGSETINAMNKLSQDEIVKVNNAILKQRLEDHEREKKTNPNPYYGEYTVGLPDRFKRFEIK